MSKPHVLVAGGGIVGCMTALELADRGCRVTLVERNVVASQTSGESSWAGAGILFPLLPWMYAEAVNKLTLTGAALYPALCERLLRETGIDPEFMQSGMLLLPKFDEAAATAWCQAHDIEAVPVPAAQLQLQSLSAGNGLWLPTVGQVRPPHLLQALRKMLELHGIELLERTELKPLPAMASLHEWETVGGKKLKADKFVVTSGAWSFELLRANALKLNIKPMRGQILLYEQPAAQLEHMVYREGFYLVPRKDGLLIAGSTLEDVGFDSSTTDEVKDALKAKAEAVLPQLKDMPIRKHWSGLRPGTPENLPTIAEHPEVKNLYLNTGHFRYGLTMAPCSAKMVAALICGEQPLEDARPFAFPV
ncbi:MAG TPA: glycine oxidase ThiO [Methylophilaceae bacterium]|nr:glycine oxidase ThiO [Methylophilaceae bacterium]